MRTIVHKDTHDVSLVEAKGKKMKIKNEKGGATLLAVLVAGFTVLSMALIVNLESRSAVMNTYNSSNSNAAKVSASAGIQAMTQYVQTQYAANPDLLPEDTAGTTASTKFNNKTAPFILSSATTSVTANTFSVGTTPSVGSGYILLQSTGKSGNAVAIESALLGITSASGGSGNAITQPVVQISNSSGTTSGDISILGGGTNGLGNGLSINGPFNAAGFGGSTNHTGANTFAGVAQITSTGDVNLTSAAGYDINGTTTPVSVFSNGSIDIAASGNFGTVQAVGNITVSGTTDTISQAQSNGTQQYSESYGAAGSVISSGAVSLNTQNSVTFNTITSDGALNISTGYGSSYTDTINTANIQNSISAYPGNILAGGMSGTLSANQSDIGGVLNYSGTSTTTVGNLVINPSYTVNITQLTAKTVSTPQVYAQPLASQANFIVAQSSTTDPLTYLPYTMITIQNVAGIPAGTYYLTTSNWLNGIQNQSITYACTSGTIPENEYYNENVPTPSVSGCYPVANMSSDGQFQYPDYVQSYKYTACTDSAINTCNQQTPPSPGYAAPANYSDVIPGVWYFANGLSVLEGMYTATIISDGTAQPMSAVVTAPNYAGLGTCENSDTVLAGYYPTQFCGSSGTTFTPTALGNVALYVGGENNTANNLSGQSGGNSLYLYLPDEFYGDIVAQGLVQSFNGNYMKMHGYLYAAGQGAAASGNPDTLPSKLVIDLKSLPKTFNPNIDTQQQYASGSPSTTSSTTTAVSVLSRFYN
ncbi:hypothetical protein HAP94_12195 [Acidithiobacillus ferrivorans]|nr:hypothetical protein [Acidithiobacillus ferrivorans]